MSNSGESSSQEASAGHRDRVNDMQSKSSFGDASPALPLNQAYDQLDALVGSSVSQHTSSDQRHRSNQSDVAPPSSAASDPSCEALSQETAISELDVKLENL